MYIKKTRDIPIKECKVGMKFDTLKVDGSTHFASFEIIDVNPFRFKVKVFDKYEEEYSTENAYAIVELTKEELANKYAKEISEVKKAMANKLPNMEDEYRHEMWNGWVCGDYIDMTIACLENDIKVIGYFPLTWNKQIGHFTTLDIGVVAEEADGERFWCHASSKWFKEED